MVAVMSKINLGPIGGTRRDSRPASHGEPHDRERDVPMHLERESNPEYEILRIIGSIVAAESVELSRDPSLQNPSKNLVLDLAQVDFLDSVGLGVLVNLIRAFKSAGRKCVFASPPPTVRNTFRLTHIDKIVDIRETLEEAIAVAGA